MTAKANWMGRAVLLCIVMASLGGASQAVAQSGDWTWTDGSSTVGTVCVSTYPCGRSGVYGTKGTSASTNSPGSRMQPVSWTDASGRKWLFGGFGYDSNGALGELNDLWQANSSGTAWSWISGANGAGYPGVYGTLGTASASTAPGGRQGAASWTDKAGNLWLFGGFGYDSNTTSNYGSENDLWMYNPTTNQWTWESGSSTVPPPQSTYFGTEPGVSAGVYGTQGVAAAGNTPGGRSNASTWVDSSGNLWLFGGGFTDTNSYEEVYNDLWEFNTTTKQWTWVEGSSSTGTTDQLGVYGTLGTPASGNIPGARYLASSWTDSSGNFWLFGGSGYTSNAGQYNLNDLWKFTPASGQWTWMGGASVLYPCNILFSTPCPVPGSYGTMGTAASTNFPGARSSALTSIDSSGNLWLFGGSGQDANNKGAWLNDLWKYNPSTTYWTWIGGSSTIPTTCTTGNCGQSGVYGALGTADPANVPGARVFSVSWTDQSGNFWLFGGQGEDSAGATGYLNDLWEYQPAGGSSTPTVATPTFSVAGGTYSATQSVTISDSTSGATIYYTTNGTTPTTSSSVYSTAISVSSTETLEAIAVASGYTNSAVATAAYTITQPTAATPTFSVAPGTYSTAQTVTLSDSTSGATIYYTTNGTTPTTSSAVYSTAVSVSSTETLEAIAVASGYTNSAVATAAYTITPLAPGVSFTPTPVAFGNQVINTSSSAMVVVLTNTGTGPLTGISLSITGVNPGAFAQANTCIATLAPSATCNISVTFTPSATGANSASLAVADNASGSPQTVALTGTGTAAATPSVTLSPTSLAFPSTTVGVAATSLPVTLSNPGTAALAISNITVSGANASSFGQSNSCGASLAAGASCTITVSFTPSASGALGATLSVIDNATGSPHTLAITGTGAAPLTPQATLAPGSLAFTATTSTAASNQNVTLTNAGTATLNIASAVLAGANPTAFTLIASPGTPCGSTLAAGASCSLTVGLTSSTVGSYTATLLVTDNASPTTQSIPITGTVSGVAQAVFSPLSLLFAGTPISTTSAAQALTFTNNGSAALTSVGSVTISGTGSAVFAQTNNCPATLNPGASCTVNVTFTPSSATSFAASVSISTSIGSQSASLSGTGTSVTQTAQATLSPTSLTFLSTPVGTTTAGQTFTLSNPGNASLTGIAVSLTGANPTDFAQTNTCGASLAAGASCLITVTFTPLASGPFAAAISVADNASGSPQSVSIAGTGAAVVTGGATFTIGSSTSSASVQPGGAAQFNLQVAPSGGSYTNVVTLSASGLPAGAQASFLPPSVTPGSAGGSSVLTIQTATGIAHLATPQRPGQTPIPLLAVLAGVPLLGFAVRVRRFRKATGRWVLLALAALAILPALALTGCGGGYFGPAPRTYTVTVVGTSGSLQQSTTISLTVQ